MSTVFDDAWQNGGVLDDHFGEEFTIMQVAAPTPTTRIDVNAPAVPLDPVTNPPTTFIGVFRTIPAERYPESRGHAASDAQLVSSGVVAVEYQTDALPFVPKLRDIIIRTSTGSVYEIADAGDELFGRRRFKLTARRG